MSGGGIYASSGDDITLKGRIQEGGTLFTIQDSIANNFVPIILEGFYSVLIDITTNNSGVTFEVNQY